MNIIGKPTINPIVFYSGKVAGYCLWILLVLRYVGVLHFPRWTFSHQDAAVLILISLSVMFIVLSSIYLGSSTRLGLPSESTQLKTHGIYRFSRNPMYVGFDLLTVAAAVETASTVTVSAAVYCLMTYHFIILGEERFLMDRFEDEYRAYRRKVRRYI